MAGTLALLISIGQFGLTVATLELEVNAGVEALKFIMKKDLQMFMTLEVVTMPDFLALTQRILKLSMTTTIINKTMEIGPYGTVVQVGSLVTSLQVRMALVEAVETASLAVMQLAYKTILVGHISIGMLERAQLLVKAY